MKKRLIALCSLLVTHCSYANAAELGALQLTGYGTIGAIYPEFAKPDVLGDWRIRGQLSHNFGQTKIGAVYSIDQIAIDQNHPMRDAFGFLEYDKFGRIEIGFTDSVARKLGVGLPDVGGMRINEQPLYMKKISPDGNVISDTVFNTGRYWPRVNLVSAPIGNMQYGLSASAADTYKYNLDFGLKYRQPYGKLKTSVAFGAGYTDAPNGHTVDLYAPKLTADFRAQTYVGLNLQYNSWLIGLTTRVIYDENAIGSSSDGVSAGIGASYDLLKYNVSASYTMSDTGIWNDTPNYTLHAGVASFRYKYSENLDVWISGGITGKTPFIGAGLRAKI